MMRCVARECVVRVVLQLKIQVLDTLRDDNLALPRLTKNYLALNLNKQL
jgi:hypothetical protein